MPDISLQLKARNGDLYVYDKNANKWFVFHSVKELPSEILEQIKDIQEKAEILRSVE